jgi:hypothetical protein
MPNESFDISYDLSPATEWNPNPPQANLISSLIVKEKVSTVEKDWIHNLIRELYRLPAAPKVEPKFVDNFIKNNKLTFVNPEFPFADPNGHVGLEVEVENVSYINPNIPLCFWQITEDGSLRNHGKEFKTFAIPLKYSQLALEQLFSGLNPDIDFSNRTSIHAHLDVRGMTMEQVLTLLFTYACVENLLFKFAGVQRRNSIFCTPITETRLFMGLNISNKTELRNHFQNVWQKYSALNVLPIQTFGTVEFRQMPGTSDVPKLCIWLDLLSRIRLFAYKTNFADVIGTISDLNTNSQYRKFVESVFGSLTVYLDTTSLLNDMEKAVYICKNCTAVNAFHQKIIKSKHMVSALTNLFGMPKDIKAILGTEFYTMFKDLKKGTNDMSDAEFYDCVQSSLRDYIRAFPPYKSLFDFMKGNPI